MSKSFKNMPKCICIPNGCSLSAVSNIIKYEEKGDM